MSVDTQLASGHAGIFYLVQMDFASGTVRATNWGHAIDWGGYTWLAVNAIASMSPVRVSERTEYPAMDLGLQVANDALLAAVLNDPTDYRGKPITIWQGFMDDQLRVMDDPAPEPVWAGDMDRAVVNTGNGENEEGSISLRCEQQGKDKRGVMSLRLNNAQHQRRYPGDTFLSRIEGLTGKPVPWLSKKFQEV